MKAETRIAELEKALAVVRDRLTLLALPGDYAEIVKTLVEMINKVLAIHPSTRLERLLDKQNRGRT
jgi:hypothetical protein